MRSPAPTLVVQHPGSKRKDLLAIKRPRNALLADQLGLPPSLQDLAEDVEAALNASGAASTTNGMKSAWAAWVRFCTPRGIPPSMRLKDPLRPLTLASFKVALVQGLVPPVPHRLPRKYTAASANVYASAVNTVHEAQSPKALLARITKGIKHVAPTRPRAVHDLTLHQITTMVVAAMDDACTSLRDVRNAYVHLYLLLSMSRSENAVAGSVQDYSPDWDLSNAAVQLLACGTVIKAQVWHGKSNAPGHRHGEGESFPTYIAGEPGSPLDPVALHKKYIRLRGEAAGTDPFFIQVTSQGLPTSKPLTYDVYLKELRRDIKRHFPALNAALYGTHTFRRVAATLALMKRLPVDLIQIMGQWTSLTFMRYFNLDDSKRSQAAHFFAAAPSKFQVKAATQESDRARAVYTPRHTR